MPPRCPGVQWERDKYATVYLQNIPEILITILPIYPSVVGYEFANETIVLRLTLDGHRLQTEKIFAKTDKVAVDTSISWTTKKGDIKR